MSDLTPERQESGNGKEKLKEYGTPTIVAVIVTVLLQFGVIGPRQVSEKLDLERRIVRVEEKAKINEERLNRSGEDVAKQLNQLSQLIDLRLTNLEKQINGLQSKIEGP